MELFRHTIPVTIVNKSDTPDVGIDVYIVLNIPIIIVNVMIVFSDQNKQMKSIQPIREFYWWMFEFTFAI